ncbi:MAG: hypothetical protein RM338_07290 [Nostoc sp. DedQUE12a]|nr:hypothetical protein [Nostoc sp. DedQUE12a]
MGVYKGDRSLLAGIRRSPLSIVGLDNGDRFFLDGIKRSPLSCLYINV